MISIFYLNAISSNVVQAFFRMKELFLMLLACRSKIHLCLTCDQWRSKGWPFGGHDDDCKPALLNQSRF